MASKIRKLGEGWLHFCQGCGTDHHIPTSGRVSWEFSGTEDSPTFSPSVKHSWYKSLDSAPAVKICHYFIRNGFIEYCSDSTHALSGKTVELQLSD